MHYIGREELLRHGYCQGLRRSSRGDSFVRCAKGLTDVLSRQRSTPEQYTFSLDGTLGG